jgi:hypothetical protein
MGHHGQNAMQVREQGYYTSFQSILQSQNFRHRRTTRQSWRRDGDDKWIMVNGQWLMDICHYPIPISVAHPPSSSSFRYHSAVARVRPGSAVVPQTIDKVRRVWPLVLVL